MWAFQHADVERAFLLHYQGPAVPYGLASAVISLLLAMFKAVTAAVLQTAYVLDGQLWWRIVAAAYMPLLYLIMGRERYIFYFGAAGLWIRLVFAAGWITGPRPGSCNYPHCALLWHHRLLAIHAASVLHRIQSGWYWLGGVMAWVVAAAVEVADPEYACPASMSCLIAGLQASAATPAAALQNVLQAALRSSKVAAVDVVLPGLLLAWLELRARKAWWQKQLQQQPATAPADAAAAGCAAQLSKEEDILEHYQKEQHHNIQLLTGSCSCSSAHTDATVAVELPRQQQKGNSQALAERCFMQHAQQLPSSTGNAEVPAAANTDMSSATAEPPDTGAPPKQQQQSKVGGSPAGAPGASADSSRTQQNVTGSAAALQNTPIAGVQQSATASVAATDSASLLPCAQAQDALAEAIPPAEGSTADSTVSSSSTGQVLPAPSPTAAPALAPAAPVQRAVGPVAAAAELLQQQLKPKRVSALYVSPLEGVVVSVKFNDYPGKGLVAIKRFQHQLAAAVEDAAMAAAAGRTPQPLEGPGSAVAAWVTSTAAFPGCFQVVMHLALPRGQVYGSPDTVQHQLLQGIQRAAQQTADAWPDCKGLIDVQLKLLQEQQQSQQQPLPAVGVATHAAPTAEITAAAPTAEITAAVGADIDTFLTAAWPVLLPANYGSSYGISVLPVAVVAPSLDTAATTTLQVELCIPGRVVEQLSATGQRSVRVVVASQFPAEGVLLDHMYKLPDVLIRQAAAASISADPADSLTVLAPSLDADSAATAAAETETAQKRKAVGDGSHQLHTVPHKQNPANFEAGVATEGVALASLMLSNAELAAAATALAEAADDWHVQLQVPWNPSTHLVLQQLQVLTSVVLAGHVEKLDKLSSSGGHSAATAAAVSSKPFSSQASTNAQTDAAADAASLHGLIAELPLLVLPEGPASELNKLFEATVEEGVSAREAYAEMLPLLRDMAAALCVAAGSSYTATPSYPSYGSVPGQNDMSPMLLEALSVFFVQHDMQSCEQLLDAVNSCQQFGTQMSGGIGLQGPGGDGDSSKGGASEGGSKNNDNENNSAGGRTDHDRALNSSGAVLSGSSGSRTEKANECSDRPGTVSGSCNSMPSDRASDNSSTTSMEIDREIHKGGSRSAKTGDEKGAPARKAITPLEEWDALDWEHSLRSPGVLRVSPRTVLFGFPSAAVEAAYLKFRAARLHLLDFVFAATGPAAVILPVVQLLLLLWSGFATGGSFSVDRILALTLRTIGVGTHWLAHAVVWGANSGIAVLQPLRLWRSAVLLAGIGFVMSVTVAFKMRGGAWARAAMDVLQDFRGTFLGFCLHRDLLYPLFACTEIVPYNIIFVVMQFVLFDRLFERPAIPGFGYVGSAAFLVLVQQAIAILVEASLRKRFVRHVQATYS